MKQRVKDTKIAVWALLACLLITSMLSIRLGAVSLSWEEFWGGLFWQEGYENCSMILYQLRLPRMFGAILAGAGLSLAGVLLQSVTGNDLAAPNIIGVNAGAGFCVIVFLWLAPAFVKAVPFAAFFGAFLTTLFILGIASRVGNSKSTVILAGIAVTAMLNAGISFVSLMDSDVLTSYNYFSVGGLSAVTGDKLVIPAILIGGSLLAAWIYAGRIGILCLGDAIAASLGVAVKRTRFLALILASASAAAVVSYAGLLGFVGLIVPHMARKLWGSTLQRLIPFSAMTGAILVLLADCAGRVLFAPSELPVGIVMALIGAPFFFGLLMRRRNSYAAD